MKQENMNELIDLYTSYMQLRKEVFFEHVLFSYQWWILISIIILLWGVWVILVDKRRIHTILSIGLITCIIALILDDMGLSLRLWDYPYQIAYFTTRLDPVDMAIIPVSYMLLYQYAKTWKGYLITLILLSLFGTFVAEPLVVKLGIYVLLRWEYWYSIPFYIIIGIFAKWVVDRLTKNHA